MSKGGTGAREMMSGGVKVGLSAGRIGTRRGAMQQMCRENHGWARTTVSAELVGSRGLSCDIGGAREGTAILISTPLGPQRGLKRHDLQESDVRHCLSRWGL